MGKRGPKSDNWVERFWTYIKKTPSCWIWSSISQGHRYGVISIEKKRWRAHRASYLLHYGSFDENLHVLHKCDDPRCVNPEHLFLGSHQENMKDRNFKKRYACLVGEKNGQAKLTAADVIYIRSKPGIPIKKLAQTLNVSIGCIEDIIYNRSWKHI